MPISLDKKSTTIANELSELHYEEAMDRADTRLAKATNEYIEALRERALEIDRMRSHPELDVCDFMLVYHDNIGQLFHDV
jgi:hypothetical protein